MKRSIVRTISLERLELISQTLMELKNLTPNIDTYEMDILIFVLDSYVRNYKSFHFDKIFYRVDEVCPKDLTFMISKSIGEKLEEYFPDFDHETHLEQIEEYVKRIFGLITHYIKEEIVCKQYRTSSPNYVVRYSEDTDGNIDDVLFSFDITKSRYERGLLKRPEDVVLIVMWRLV